jgi:hypothetical protein
MTPAMQPTFEVSNVKKKVQSETFQPYLEVTFVAQLPLEHMVDASCLGDWTHLENQVGKAVFTALDKFDYSNVKYE